MERLSFAITGDDEVTITWNHKKSFPFNQTKMTRETAIRLIQENATYPLWDDVCFPEMELIGTAMVVLSMLDDGWWGPWAAANMARPAKT